jgi:hypothetical protein
MFVIFKTSNKDFVSTPLNRVKAVDLMVELLGSDVGEVEFQVKVTKGVLESFSWHIKDFNYVLRQQLGLRWMVMLNRWN